MDLRDFVDALLRFESVARAEAPAQQWVKNRLHDFGFETYEWTADPERLAEHPSFPDDPDDIDTADRPSVAGAVEFGDPGAGPTLVLNGHVDVVPADRELWSHDPFLPDWDDDAGTVSARGAADMKAGLAACVFAALDLRDAVEAGDLALDGRVVVESVAGEEDGGIGAAAAALDNPYPFERDAALVAEPTRLKPVVATEGSVMKRLHLTGRTAHAASRWRGVDVIEKFEAIREAFFDLEAERTDAVSHPRFDYPIPWPVCVGRVEAGSWASSVAGTLTAEWRLGVAPGETVAEVEAAFEERLARVVADDEWLSAHPPAFERFSVQFEPAEIDADEPVVEALRAALRADGRDDDPVGATYGADSRHYVEAGIPTVLFGPGDIDNAHFPDETVEWAEVEVARDVIGETATRFLQSR
ncbi:M20/M25/M40 family metallo-hydrolase [Haloferax denitrificans]|uniref:Acetylornithine deacetylase n=1 Tax=Haloferax denitrificans ATCC 35960 TaxID=662478 RepID=M0JJN6_9EURY|nr:M20/M25/M40 family metallo-hydrolase [Haloferax denitrificans]EMA08528.1 acetylornithine deacetylase [Haloferax denitrificans ATCC 35960]